ncbi:VOC family protein [Nitrosospira sp. Nsp13]|uniref:VOC family protein n=1 Tax=Nitrosospira sp. Nsp13 TaxID=1855332 RepID=UPI000882607C|nr:VOC family protein [Nitrosospira sp. Nsp13]SCX79476.1 Glyoxalase/Bleomycin resistance protein/Dioxygenase superfamily protein [Nitrosospira sp. Nsp13]
MTTIGFNHFNLRAPRELMDELKAFYCDIVGLEQGQRPDLGTPGYWLYAGNQCVLHLSQTKPDETRLTHTSTTFDHVAFTCTNRAEMEAHLKRNNISFTAGQVPSMGITQLFLKDPAGNGVELNFAERTF